MKRATALTSVTMATSLSLPIALALALLCLCFVGTQQLQGQANIPQLERWVSSEARNCEEVEDRVRKFVQTGERNRVEQAYAWNLLARFQASAGEKQAAIESLSIAKDLLHSPGNAHPKIIEFTQRSLLQLESLLSYELENYQRGIEAASECIQLVEKRPLEDEYLVFPLNERGLNYMALDQMAKAMQDFNRALNVLQRFPNLRAECRTRANMATVYYELNEYDKAMAQYQTLENLANKISDATLPPRLALNKANCLFQLQRFDECRSQFETALKLAGDKPMNREVRAMVFKGLADLERYRANEHALTDYRKSLRLSRELELKSYSAHLETLIVQITDRNLEILGAAYPLREGEVGSSAARSDPLLRKLEEQLEFARKAGTASQQISVLNKIARRHAEKGRLEDQIAVQGQLIQIQFEQLEERQRANVAKVDSLYQTIDEKEGDNFWLQVALAHLVLFAGIMAWLYRVNRKKSEKLARAHSELRESMQRSLFLEKMAGDNEKQNSLTQTTAEMIHDFNNFLTAIISATEVGQRTDQKTVKDEMFEVISKSGTSAADLAGKFNRLLVDHGSKLEVCDINTLIESSQGIWKQLCRDKCQLIFSAFNDDATVRIDQAEIRQALTNLVKNAAEAIESDGLISISVQITQQAISESLDQSERVVQIVIDDNGCGISEEDIRRVTQPYYSTKGRGRGFGLSSVKDAVEKNDGWLQLTSKKGVGTRVTIRFPLVVPSANDDKTTPSQDVDLHGSIRDKRVLLVERDSVIQTSIQRYLERAGASVTIAGSITQACQLIREAESNFNLVLTEFELGDGNAEDLKSQLAQDYPSLPFVVLCNRDNDHLRVPHFKMLKKPFRLNDLAELMIDPEDSST